MSDEFAPSEEFEDFFFLAIDHGFESVEDGGGPLIPFVISTATDGNQSLTRFVAEELSDGVEKAREFVEKHRGDMVMYAIAWDGYITLENKKWDAIFVEAGEGSNPEGVLFCQRYQAGKAKLLGKAKNERVGNPALIERPRSRIAS